MLIPRHLWAWTICFICVAACNSSQQNEFGTTHTASADQDHPVDIAPIVLNIQLPPQPCKAGFCIVLPVTELGSGRAGFDAIWGSPEGEIWGAGFDASVVHWNKKEWRQWPYMGSFTGLWGFGARDVWAVGDNIVRWNGTQWETRKAGLKLPRGLLWNIWGTDPNNIWAAGEFGTIARWNGTSWSEEKLDEGDISKISGASAKNMWTLGGTPSVLSRWDGTRWSSVPLPNTEVFYHALWVSGDHDVWLGAKNLIAHWNGTGWTDHAVDGWVESIYGRGDRLVATGARENGAFLVEWKGTTWTDIPIPDLGQQKGLSYAKAIYVDHQGKVWLSLTNGALLTR